MNQQDHNLSRSNHSFADPSNAALTQKDKWYNFLRAQFDQKQVEIHLLETERDRLSKQMEKVLQDSPEFIPPLCQMFVQQCDGTVRINPRAWDELNKIEQHQLVQGNTSGMVIQECSRRNQ